MAAQIVGEDGLLKDFVLTLEEGLAVPDEREEPVWTVGRDPDLCRLILEDPLPKISFVVSCLD